MRHLTYNYCLLFERHFAYFCASLIERANNTLNAPPFQTNSNKNEECMPITISVFNNSDSINQNAPIKYLKNRRPTRGLAGNGQWAPNQRELMDAMDDQYNLLADHVINNFI